MSCGSLIFVKIDGIVFLFALNEVEILLFFRTVGDACPYGFGIDKVGATATLRVVFARPRWKNHTRQGVGKYPSSHHNLFVTFLQKIKVNKNNILLEFKKNNIDLKVKMVYNNDER